MKTHPAATLIAFIFIFLFPFASLGAEVSRPVDKTTIALTSQAQWKTKMQNLHESLSDLLTDVCSDERYYNPKNKSRIEREIKKLATFSHELKQRSESATSSDPSLSLFSSFLASETKEAELTFRTGFPVYAREILRAIPGDCLACHSRNALGPDFSELAIEPKSPLTMRERANFYAATRQFDRAIEAFQKVLRGKEKEKSDDFDFENAVYNSLLISVRFKRDPVLTKTIVQSVLDNPNSPSYLKESATHWKHSIDEWISEASDSKKQKNGDELYQEAVKLMNHARSLQGYTFDHGQDIAYLRASSSLYDLLQLEPTGKHVSEALLLLGMCSELLSLHRMENLNNVYYEACIRHSPHSETSKTCYQRYEESVYIGFTGSSGTHIPPDLKQKLSELNALVTDNKGND